MIIFVWEMCSRALRPSRIGFRPRFRGFVAASLLPWTWTAFDVATHFFVQAVPAKVPLQLLESLVLTLVVRLMCVSNKCRPQKELPIEGGLGYHQLPFPGPQGLLSVLEPDEPDEVGPAWNYGFGAGIYSGYHNLRGLCLNQWERWVLFFWCLLERGTSSWLVCCLAPGALQDHINLASMVTAAGECGDPLFPEHVVEVAFLRLTVRSLGIVGPRLSW